MHRVQLEAEVHSEEEWLSAEEEEEEADGGDEESRVAAEARRIYFKVCKDLREDLDKFQSERKLNKLAAEDKFDELVLLHGVLAEVKKKLDAYLGARGLTIRTEVKILERWKQLFESAKQNITTELCSSEDIVHGRFNLEELKQLKKVESTLQRYYPDDVNQINKKLLDIGIDWFKSLFGRLKRKHYGAREAAYMLSRQFQVVSRTFS